MQAENLERFPLVQEDGPPSLSLQQTPLHAAFPLAPDRVKPLRSVQGLAELWGERGRWEQPDSGGKQGVWKDVSHPGTPSRRAWIHPQCASIHGRLGGSPNEFNGVYS